MKDFFSDSLTFFLLTTTASERENHMGEIVVAAATLAALGAGLGGLIACAAKIFYVPTDERVTAVEEALAGLNCGMCGYGSCYAYAEAIVHAGDAVDKCVPGGAASAHTIAQVMGYPEPEPGARRWTPQVHCRGGAHAAARQFHYGGIADCRAAALYHGGPKQCRYGCLGLGSCVRVCPVEAIDFDGSDLVWVDQAACIGCGRCVGICPTGVMRWIPADAEVMVACNSLHKGPVVQKQCRVGCIGCKKCEKASPDGGFRVSNFLSRIDYDTDGDRRRAAETCPTGCILSLAARY